MKKDLPSLDQNFTTFVKEIKSKILLSQYEALKAVNKELINLYWDIGKNIVQKQEQFGWGKSVVKNLSIELQREFVGIKGFSEKKPLEYAKFLPRIQRQCKTADIVCTNWLVTQCGYFPKSQRQL